MWKLWQEIKKRDDMQCIEVLNGHGLGIATQAAQKPSWHSELECYLTALRVKGGLLNKLWILTERLEATNDKLRISARHTKNLETIIENKEKELSGLIHELEKIEAENKKLKSGTGYLLRCRIRRTLDKFFRICSKNGVEI